MTQAAGIPSTGISYQQTLSQRGARVIAHSLPYHPGCPQPRDIRGAGCLSAIGICVIGFALLAALAKEGAGAAPLLVILAMVVAVVGAYRALQASAQREYLADKESYIGRLVAAYGEEGAAAMIRGDPWQGATWEMIQIMYGRPDDVSTQVFKHTTRETWKYVPLDARRYALRINFENGVCVGWKTA